jgi:TRAP transporter TAXI family solute receptor
MKKIVFAVLMILVLSMALGVGATCAAEVINLTMGSTASTSGLYVYAVATARVVNKADAGIRVTVVESGAALDNLRRVKGGVFDVSLMVDVPSAFQMYRGVGTFKDQRWEPLRFLVFRNAIHDRLYVRRDSGVKSLSDLAGKRFSPGLPGSSSAKYVADINEALGTKIDLWPAAFGDAVKALKEGRIIGVQKSSPVNTFDAALMEVHLTTPLNVIGYTKEEVDKIRAKLPYLSFREIPAGSIKEIPGHPSFYEETPLVGGVTSSRMSEDVIYRFVKAYAEGWNEIAAVYPAVKPFHPVADYFKLVAPGAEIPAHSGMIKYAKEIGVKVEPRFIPPEYKGK